MSTSVFLSTMIFLIPLLFYSLALGVTAILCPAEDNVFYDHCKCVSVSGVTCDLGDLEHKIVWECTGLLDLGFENQINLTSEVTCLIITASPELTIINSTMLEKFPNLTGFVLRDGGLTTVEDDTFKHNPEIVALELVDQRLTKFPSLRHIPKLSFLDLDHNEIVVLPEDAFANNPDLMTVSLEDNLIERITGNTLANKCDLGQLLLGENRNLHTFESSAINGTNLDTLDLQNTQISQLPITASLRFSLTELQLTGVSTLTRFNAFSPGQPEFYYQTFPRLKLVRFPYHAYCCQMKGRHFSYGASRRREVGRSVLSLLQRFSEHFFGPARTVREASDPSYTCVNLTSQQCLTDTSNVNQSDVMELNMEQFCNYTQAICDECVRDLCQNNCSASDSVTLPNSVVCVNTSNPESVIISPTRSNQMSSTVVMSLSTSLPECFSQSLLRTSTVVDSCASTVVPHPTPTIQPTSTDGPSNTAVPQPTPTAQPPSTDGPITTMEPVDMHCTDEFCDTHPFSNECRQCQMLCFEAQCTLFFDGIDFCDCQRRKRSDRTKREESCMEERLLDCANCSTVPNGWFRLSDELVCMEVSNSTGTDMTTTSPTTTDPLQPTADPVVRQSCPPQGMPTLVRGEETECYPVEDAFNPCTNLLNDDHALRICIWIVIVLAFVGNGIVIIVFLFYTCGIRRMKMDYFVMHFFYFNLACADFCMCLYLLTIASEDLFALNRFSLEDVEWRIGNGCKFAGFTAILSTVVSVYVLTVITLERGYTITNALHRRRVSKSFAVIIMAIGWVIGFIFAILPTTNTVSSYGSVAICLPFRVNNDLDKSYVVTLLIGTGVAFVLIGATYIFIFISVFCRRKSFSHAANSKRRNEIKVGIRMLVLVVTNFICWFPIALVALASIFDEGLVDSLDFAKWAIVFIFPINACLNPILYSLSTKIFRENFVLLLSKVRLCKSAASKIEQQRAGITPSGTSQRSDNTTTGRRSTIVERLRLLSISSSQSSLPDRRDSRLSQLSEVEHHKISLINSRRRSSVLSDSSNEGSTSGRAGIRRGSSGTSLDETSVAIQNQSFRANSPTLVAPQDKLKRIGNKVSVASLGTLPEEELYDANVLKLNPAYVEDESTEEYTEEEQSTPNTFPKHNIITSDSTQEENDSGVSGHCSESPSVEEFNDEKPTVSVHKEINFD